MNIAVAANQKFLKYLYVMLTSLLENNKTADVTVYLLSADLEDAQVKFIKLMSLYTTVLFLTWKQMTLKL